jgi:hypothetical protein
MSQTASAGARPASADRPKSAATRPKQAVQTIGHYDLEKNIGEGNFAKVRLAKHTITGQQVSIRLVFIFESRWPSKLLTRTNWTRQLPKSYSVKSG